MPRDAKLSKTKVGKHIYWSSQVGGRRVYFGNVKEVGRKQADDALLEHRRTVASKPSKSPAAVTVLQLVDEYLLWSKGQFSDANYANKKSALQRWCRHKVGKGLPGEGEQLLTLTATKIEARHMHDFIAARRLQSAGAGRGTGKKKPAKPVGPNALAGDMQHVKACFNWGASNGPLPMEFRPFAYVPRIKIPTRPKNEGELLTPAEFKALLKFADHDLEPIRNANGRFRTRTKKECRQGDANPYAGFADMLRLYHGLGARTGELAGILVKHVNFDKSQVIVVAHKRANTMDEPMPRVLTLDAKELEILKRHCAGKSADDYVFTQTGGQAWCQDRLDERFKKVRTLAKVRDEITIYSFRHLWISEAIEADVPIATIAEMAGTSIKQIEATYGHIRHAHRDVARERLNTYRSKRAG